MAKAGFIRSELLAEHGFTGIFTLRQGGFSPAPFDELNFGTGLGDNDSNIKNNLSSLMEAAALPSLPHQALQIHKSGFLWCHEDGFEHPQEADILLTNQMNTAIAVRVADCLPILLADPETGLVAAVHAGWRGTAAGIVKLAVEQLLASGAKGRDLLASLGPCIGPCCFAIGEETATALQSSAINASDFIHSIPEKPAEIRADLSKINRLQLLECGMKDVHIELISKCTMCDKQLFFSFRRDGKLSGRHLAVVANLSST